MAEKTELLEEDEKVVEIELERLRGFLKDDEAVVLMVDSNLQREMISLQIPLHRITDSASNGSVFPVVTEHFSASSDHAFL